MTQTSREPDSTTAAVGAALRQTPSVDVPADAAARHAELSQIISEQLGLEPADIRVVLEMDTAKDQWSIAAGTYSSRFTSATSFELSAFTTLDPTPWRPPEWM